jgi:hypothetical protein
VNRAAPRLAALAAWLATVVSVPAAAGERAALILGGELSRQEEGPLRTAAAEAVQAAGWTVVDSTLAPSAVAELLACVGRDFSDSEGCLSEVFERTRADRAVVLRVRSTRDQGKPVREMNGWVFRPSGKALKFGQRFCHACQAGGLETSARILVATLVRGARARARPSLLMVRSIPPGAEIRLDDKAVGVTDMDFQVYPGRHIVELARDGFEVATRDVTVDDGEHVTVEVTLKPADGAEEGAPPAPWPARPEPPGPPEPSPRTPRPRSTLVPWLVIGAGGAALAAGGILLAMDQDTSSEAGVRDQDFRQTSWFAVGAGASGAVAIGVGLYLLFRPADERGPAPVVSLGDEAAWLGVQGSF